MANENEELIWENIRFNENPNTFNNPLYTYLFGNSSNPIYTQLTNNDWSKPLYVDGSLKVTSDYYGLNVNVTNSDYDPVNVNVISSYVNVISSKDSPLYTKVDGLSYCIGTDVNKPNDVKGFSNVLVTNKYTDVESEIVSKESKGLYPAPINIQLTNRYSLNSDEEADKKAKNLYPVPVNIQLSNRYSDIKNEIDNKFSNNLYPLPINIQLTNRYSSYVKNEIEENEKSYLYPIPVNIQLTNRYSYVSDEETDKKKTDEGSYLAPVKIQLTNRYSYIKNELDNKLSYHLYPVPVNVSLYPGGRTVKDIDDKKHFVPYLTYIDIHENKNKFIINLGKQIYRDSLIKDNTDFTDKAKIALVLASGFYKECVNYGLIKEWFPKKEETEEGEEGEEMEEI